MSYPERFQRRTVKNVEERVLKRKGWKSPEDHLAYRKTPNASEGSQLQEKVMDLSSYRTQLPSNKSNKPLNVWKFLKDCIGKDFSKIAMPIVLNEPLSGTQRFAEDLENAYLLTRAAQQATSVERLLYICCFVVALYKNTSRTGKPFNPLLGETYEFDLMEDRNYGFRVCCEQVSHHPPITAVHAEGNGWTFYKQVDLKSRFRGKTLEITPVGTLHVRMGQEHYTWSCLTSTVNNIIIGTLWVDAGGELLIKNHQTKDYAVLNFERYSYFSSSKIGTIKGTVYSDGDTPHFDIVGNWKDGIASARPHGKGSVANSAC
ncbi:hypothetical protein Zmor_004291 [Zophobas morio]|uniref:Oxysterol-binding protein n=1 Tax=Zophobas morio TaxID=2755281 RepID=A0AA38LZS2_9CUCU|nr:hypothetical protein Zmor_004291 [Zophobas morio]